jgi:hypothetical protein
MDNPAAATEEARRFAAKLTIDLTSCSTCGNELEERWKVSERLSAPAKGEEFPQIFVLRTESTFSTLSEVLTFRKSERVGAFFEV